MSNDARLDEERSTSRRSQILNLSYYDTSDSAPKETYKGLISVDEMRNLKIVPIRHDQNHILFGILNTTPPNTLSLLKDRFQDQLISFALISESGFREYIDIYDPPPKVEYKDISLKTSENVDLVSEVSNILEQINAADMLAYLVNEAHKLNASDIHIESKKEFVLIRFRIDGILHSIAKVSYDKYRVLLGAIASAGNISTNAKEAQQGHISQKVKMADGSLIDVNVRIETIKTINNVDVVMRLFNMDREMYSLDNLGLSQTERETVDQIIKKPSGLVMIVGPTGSGKTTTLYSMINALSTDQRKIITIEDPVEYQFDDITQISVEAGVDLSKPINFSDQIKSILRLDPDIIMVGEVRDGETARIALQAALTGHLVLTTFHADSAAGAVSRLIDIIGENPLFVSSIRLIMAQRLVRKLDDSSKVEYSPSEAEMNKISEVINSLPSTVLKPDLSQVKFYKANPTEDNPFGYKGQIAIREQFKVSDQIISLINNYKNYIPNAIEIEKAAIQSGMQTMLQDGILKVIQGITTLEEVFRVVG